MCSVWNEDAYYDEYCAVCHGSCCGDGMPDAATIEIINLREEQERLTNG